MTFLALIYTVCSVLDLYYSNSIDWLLLKQTLSQPSQFFSQQSGSYLHQTNLYH